MEENLKQLKNLLTSIAETIRETGITNKTIKLSEVPGYIYQLASESGIISADINDLVAKLDEKQYDWYYQICSADHIDTSNCTDTESLATTIFNTIKSNSSKADDYFDDYTFLSPIRSVVKSYLGEDFQNMSITEITTDNVSEFIRDALHVAEMRGYSTGCGNEYNTYE